MIESNGHQPHRYTPLQERFMRLLSDGIAHSKREFFGLLDDDLAGPTAVKTQICLLRKRIPNGQAILCVWEGRSLKYRLVRLLAPEHITG